MVTLAKPYEVSCSLEGIEEVQVFFNFRPDHEMYLSGLKLEDSPEPKRKGPPTGELLGKGTWVDTRFLDVNFKSNGFRLKNLALRDRKNGLRAVATWVPGVLHTAETLDEMHRRVYIEFGFQVLQGHFWDLRIYRNPSENGGSICIECGNPRETLWFAGSYGIRVYEGKLELRERYW